LVYHHSGLSRHGRVKFLSNPTDPSQVLKKKKSLMKKEEQDQEGIGY
jgi:hypothetical protein